jgi:uncharacterized protein
MAVDHIRYDILTQEALRSVVRDVLSDAAKNGLPGEHHFYISFDTGADGVKISPRLRELHPKDITIILQHQFWDLKVSDDRFEVGLSFNGVPEKLVVPLVAIKGFFDPSVQFGLQFETADGDGEADAETSAAAGDQNNLQKAPPVLPQAETPAPSPAATLKLVDPAPDKTGEVVRLDRFRKK